VPISPDLTAALAQATVDAYADAERSLLARIARSLAQDIDSPAWADLQLTRVQGFRRQAQDLLAALEGTARGTVGDAIVTAVRRGTATAVSELMAALGRSPRGLLGQLPGARSMTRLVEEAVTAVTSTHPRILRESVDAYRAVIAETTPRVQLGAETRREAAQTALDRFADRGVTGFVDRAGRRWVLESYTEMALRTATIHAAVDAHSERLADAGCDLIVVSDHPQECRICRPWEGKVLALGAGPVGTTVREHAIQDGQQVRIQVAGTLQQARDAGLYHPGCRHSHAAYLPGVTRPPTATADPQGDADRQKLRYLERRVRAAKRLEAAAMDPVAAKAARVKVRDRQAAIREHVANSTAKRQPAREQLGAH
jgi:hypothetical protein